MFFFAQAIRMQEWNPANLKQVIHVTSLSSLRVELFAQPKRLGETCSVFRRKYFLSQNCGGKEGSRQRQNDSVLINWLFYQQNCSSVWVFILRVPNKGISAFNFPRCCAKETGTKTIVSLSPCSVRRGWVFLCFFFFFFNFSAPGNFKRKKMETWREDEQIPTILSSRTRHSGSFFFWFFCFRVSQHHDLWRKFLSPDFFPTVIHADNTT